jgi:hypothetical protein
LAQTAPNLVDQVIPPVTVLQWAPSLPIRLRMLPATQLKLVTRVLQLVHRVLTRNVLGPDAFNADELDSGVVTLIQRFRLAASLNIHVHCMVLDGMHKHTNGELSSSRWCLRATGRFRRCCKGSSHASLSCSPAGVY